MNDSIAAREFLETEGAEDWRVVGDGACAFFRTASLAASAEFVAGIGGLPGVDAHFPELDVRADGVTVRLITATADYMGMTTRDIEFARAISGVARGLGFVSDPSLIQSFLVIPGAPDIAAIKPFWQAVLGYEIRPDSPDEDLIDPRGRGPDVWLEEMAEPRQGGGAIHVAVWLPYEQAEAQVAAALAAGGHIVRDNRAPSWWTLADSAGNECDVATIKNRD